MAIEPGYCSLIDAFGASRAGARLHGGSADRYMCARERDEVVDTHAVYAELLLWQDDHSDGHSDPRFAAAPAGGR
jgi:hypothetical protein